ncbi:MAG TPA: SDR family oxidoreductase [Caulobacteraceae bacterium]|nr:SDR family oxidoreductase [Caulobacteraceae bacterium]
MTTPLSGQVALVAGATRAAGRGIAIELAAAGAKVYCTGRSVRGAPATAGRPETIEETAEMIEAAGGRAVAVRVDHQVEAEVEALAARIAADDGRLDILVNDVWGGDTAIAWGASFWSLDIAAVRGLLDQAVMSHLITARRLAPMMVAAKRGLIVEVTDGALNGYRGQLLYDLVKASVIRLAYAMAWDLARTGVTAVAISPGFLRSEAILDGFGVTEANWRAAAEDRPDFALSETPRYIGRAIAALAADPQVRRKAGASLSVGDLADEYGFDDVDGRRPHFWREVEAWLEPQIAAAEPLDGRARFMAEAGYMSRHLTPSRAETARRYAAKLGWTRLGAGLQPIV